MNVSSFWRLEDSEDQVPKTLKTRSSDERLQIPRTWSSEDPGKRLILIKHHLKFKLIKFNGESTSDWQIVHRTEKLVQEVTFMPAKSIVHSWCTEKVSLSLSHNGYMDLSYYIRDLKKDEDNTFAQQLSEEQLFANFIISFLDFILFTSAFLEAFHCKRFLIQNVCLIFLEGPVWSDPWED